MIIAQGRYEAPDGAVIVIEKIDQSHLLLRSGQGRQVAGDGRDDAFLLMVQVSGHDHLAGGQLLLKGTVIIEAAVIQGQIQGLQPGFDADLEEIIQADGPGPHPAQDLDDPGKMRGPADQRLSRVGLQGRFIQGDDHHVLRLVADAGQLVPQVVIEIFRALQPARPGDAGHYRADRHQQGQKKRGVFTPENFGHVLSQ